MLTWQDVPGYFNFQDIYTRMVAEARDDGDHFVEIGVLFGQSTLFMADAIRRSGKRIVFDAVDRMSSESRPQWRYECLTLSQKLSSEAARAAAREAIASSPCMADISKWYARETGLDGFINFHVESGQARSGAYRDESLGFVFIDSDHSYVDTREMIQAYLSKVRTGGVLAGHDYNHGEWPEVVRAVNETLWNKFKIIGDSWISRKQGPVRRLYLPW
jgi:predicted O-methyltransferase YrrM